VDNVHFTERISPEKLAQILISLNGVFLGRTGTLWADGVSWAKPPGLQPFLDQAQDASVRDTVLNKLP
jgi:hypothetical protein